MTTLTNNQIEYIKDNFDNEVYDAINEMIDNELIYDSDIKEHVFKFTSITALLNGEYSMQELYEDLYDEFYNDDDTFIEIFDSYLDTNQQQEVLEQE